VCRVSERAADGCDAGVVQQCEGDRYGGFQRGLTRVKLLRCAAQVPACTGRRAPPICAGGRVFYVAGYGMQGLQGTGR
jgi:hypothetical protein